MNLTSVFIGTPGERFEVRERGVGLFQLVAPIFHEDGDMMNIYMEETEDGRIRISDKGSSLMRLSYTFELDTDNKRKILNDLVLRRGGELNNGDISIVTKKSTVFESIMTFSQLVSQICNMDILSHEIVANLFYDYLAEAIEAMNINARYARDYQPTKNPDIIVDHAFWSKASDRPLFLYGVKDTNKAQQTTIQCLTLQLEKVPHASVTVFQDINSVAGKSQRALLNACGKVFTDLDGLAATGKEYIQRELRIA